MSKLYEYEQITDALIDSGLKEDDLRTALDAINNIDHYAVIRECNNCMGAAFNDCEKCERFKKNHSPL